MTSKIFLLFRKLIHQLRSRKSAAEVELMRQSCSMASNAIKETIMGSNTMSTEHELHASVEYKYEIFFCNEF